MKNATFWLHGLPGMLKNEAFWCHGLLDQCKNAALGVHVLADAGHIWIFWFHGHQTRIKMQPFRFMAFGPAVQTLSKMTLFSFMALAFLVSWRSVLYGVESRTTKKPDREDPEAPLKRAVLQPSALHAYLHKRRIDSASTPRRALYSLQVAQPLFHFCQILIRVNL